MKKYTERGIKMIDESIKFAWAYLLKHGRLTNGKWCIYSGWESVNRTFPDLETDKKLMEELVFEVLTHGIDWKNTSVPSVSEKVEFQDTGSLGATRLVTVGTLVLNNGLTYNVCSTDKDAAHLAEAARQLLAKKTSPVQELANLL